MCQNDNIEIKSVAVLTSRQSWFVPFAQEFVDSLKARGCKSELFHNHDDVDESFHVVFILSYFCIIDDEFLKQHRYNLVVHESDLPDGKGWAPLFWQILEGKVDIPVVLFEASTKVDAGDVYLKDHIVLQGHELHDEIREKQALKTIELCSRFLDSYKQIEPVRQSGVESFYPRRTPKDSELDVEKGIAEQFNLLRIVNNDAFPAFFYWEGKKYILKIYEEESNS